jgi:hypothetical protein
MHFGTFSDTQRILLQPGKLLHQSPVLIEIGLERAPLVVFVYVFPHLNMQNPADYGPQQH